MTDVVPPPALAPSAETQLLDSFLTLRTRDEVREYLLDLCTPSEIRAFAERLEVARLLHEGVLSYRQIAEQAGASTATVVRVARFLKEAPYGGYQRALTRLAEHGR